ncbi:hypothetical protein SNE40_020492 [Patella caerulea]|uniref:Uncharacterized protein n=1 Tax=Patella caerulea TaxID=87958 RepID=A0AAN8GB01_PATCE
MKYFPSTVTTKEIPVVNLSPSDNLSDGTLQENQIDIPVSFPNDVCDVNKTSVSTPNGGISETNPTTCTRPTHARQKPLRYWDSDHAIYDTSSSSNDEEFYRIE